jgi:hypothetical protein
MSVLHHNVSIYHFFEADAMHIRDEPSTDVDFEQNTCS